MKNILKSGISFYLAIVLSLIAISIIYIYPSPVLFKNKKTAITVNDLMEPVLEETEYGVSNIYWAKISRKKFNEIVRGIIIEHLDDEKVDGYVFLMNSGIKRFVDFTAEYIPAGSIKFYELNNAGIEAAGGMTIDLKDYERKLLKFKKVTKLKRFYSPVFEAKSFYKRLRMEFNTWMDNYFVGR